MAGLKTMARRRSVKHGYFSEDDETTVLSGPRGSAPRPETVPIFRVQQDWDRECAGQVLVRPVDVLPTVIVTARALASLCHGPARLEGIAAPSGQVARHIDLSRVPSTARRGRRMVVVDASPGCLVGDPVQVVASETGELPPGAVRVVVQRRGNLRVRLERQIPKLSIRCALLRRSPRLAPGPVAAELFRDTGVVEARGWLLANDDTANSGCLVPALDDDPTAAGRVVGAWLRLGTARTGLDACYDPRIVDACRALFSRTDLRCVEPDVALLAVFYKKCDNTNTRDVAFCEASLVFERPDDDVASIRLVDFVADVEPEDPTTNSTRAVLAARLRPRTDEVASVSPLASVSPVAPASPVGALAPPPPSPAQPPPARQPSLQAQLHELRRRLDELEARARVQAPPRREIATATTESLLVPRTPQVDTADQLVPTSTATAASVQTDALVQGDDDPPDEDEDDALVPDALAGTPPDPASVEDDDDDDYEDDAMLAVEGRALALPDEDTGLIDVDVAASPDQGDSHTIVVPRIVCPHDVDDLLAHDEDDEDDHMVDVDDGDYPQERRHFMTDPCLMADDDD